MSDTLTELAAELAADLAGLCTVAVIAGIPAQLLPPCNLVIPGDPWITTAGRTFGDLGIVHFDVLVVAGTATDTAAVTALESQVLEVAAAVDFDTISAPQRRQYGDRLFLTATVSLSLTL